MLFRKVIRDLKQNAIQFLAIFVMTFFALFVVGGFDFSDTGEKFSIDEYFRDTNLVKLDESEFVHEVNNWGDIYRYITEHNK